MNITHFEPDMDERQPAEPSTVEQRPTSATHSHRYDYSGKKRFRDISDRLLALLSTSSDGTWQTVNWRPFTNESDAAESDYGADEVFGRILEDALLAGYGLHVLDQLLGSPIYDPQSLDRMLKQDVALIAADWAYDIKPYDFAAIWRAFADLRDGKIDDDTAMRRTESTRAKIRGTIARWGDIYDMIEETGSLDDVIAWAKRHGIDDIPPPENPTDESDYRQDVLKEFTENLYPGAADLPDDELTALLNRAVQQPIRITDGRRKILGLLFHGAAKDGTVTRLASRAGMTYPGVFAMLRKLETAGLIEKIDGPRVTYALVSEG